MTLPFADTNFVEATWILVVKSIVIFAVIFAIVPMLTVLERKLLGRFQARYGPNRVGPFGLLQPLADAVKLVTKEGYRPRNAVPILWSIAPAIVVFTGVATLAIIPFGDVKDGVGFYGIDVSIGTTAPALPSAFTGTRKSLPLVKLFAYTAPSASTAMPSITCSAESLTHTSSALPPGLSR